MENLEDAREEMERTGIDGAINPNRWCYEGKEIPVERRSGRLWGAGAGGARRMWLYYAEQHRTETERMIHCQGCKYLQTAGSFLICGYLLDTGKRRPCPFGGPCKAKKLLRGYKLPEDYEARIAAAEEKKRRKTAGAGKEKEPGKRGPKRGWDEEYAIALFRREFMLSEISEVMGVSYSSLRKVGIRNGWYYAGHRGVRSHKKDIAAEKARYREYLAEKHNSGK